MNVIVAFGNPLLDTTVTVADDEILRKYNLKNDDQREITADEMRRLLRDIQGLEQAQSPGGCAQNTLRVMQWLLRHKCSTTIVGAVGKDRQGEILRQLLEKDGVQTKYIELDDRSTGTTVALVNGASRALLACLGAAEALSLDDLTLRSDAISRLEAADLVYLEGFFITKRVAAARLVLERCGELKKPFAFNLSGRYLFEVDPGNVRHFAEQCDILFGNREEFRALASYAGTGFKSLIADLAGKRRDKVVVVTGGAKSVVCAHSGGKVDEIGVPSIDASELVDTTGAGDAFVAGFLAGWLLRRAPLNCAELGCYAAQEIIKRTGCTLPTHPPNVLL